jgi:NAD dependent epimerase/dehydratase family enzyme
VLGRPAAFPAPTALLRLLLWGQADLLLHGRRAVPAKAIAAGYLFRFSTIEAALREALGRP